MSRPGSRGGKRLFPPTKPPKGWESRRGFALPVRHAHEQPFERASGEFVNNSGTGEAAPPEVLAMGLCWPAFTFGHRFAVRFGLQSLPAVIDGMKRPEYLVRHGYEAAWRYHRFGSYGEFRRTMQTLHARVVGVLVVEGVLFLIAAVEAAGWYATHWPPW